MAVDTPKGGNMQVSPRLGDGEQSMRSMVRALGVLYACGGSLAIVWTLLPHPPETGDGVVVTMAVLAVLLGAALWTRMAARMPVWALHAVIALIQVVISVAYVAVATPENDIRLYYTWATPYAAFFFGRRAALNHSLWTAACVASSLSVMGGPFWQSSRVWLMTVGAVAAVAILVSIVSGRMRRVQDLLHAAAVRDPLTGLANRRGFAAALDDALESQKRLGGAVVVALVDLDHFKLVNDSFGHHVGDGVLRAIAPRLVDAVRPGDLVARMGGDEFAIVIRDLDGTLDVSGLVARVGEAWVEQVEVGGLRLPVSGSVGVVRTSPSSATAEALLRDADVALYRAKAVQRGSAVVYEDSLREEMDRRAVVDRGLRGAADRGELALAFQPVVDVRTGAVTGAEALLRWTSPDLGPVSPAEFVPVAEDRGLIVGIGEWALEEACRTLAEWRASGVVDAGFVLAVNVSGRQLCPGFGRTVSATLARHHLPPSAIHLEITESVLLDDTPHMAAALAELTAIGARILLDDFGTGYSSLSYLNRLPLAGLKIDKSFVDHLGDSARHRILVSTIIAMADGLGMTVVAEGVEDREAAATLEELGCRHAQGYLWARPESADDFRLRMTRRLRVVRRTTPVELSRIVR